MAGQHQARLERHTAHHQEHVQKHRHMTTAQKAAESKRMKGHKHPHKGHHGRP